MKNQVAMNRRAGKKFKAAAEKVEHQKRYLVQDAFTLLPSLSFAKFDESIEVAVNLGIDPKHADQMVRGGTVLPHGTGRKVQVAVLAKGDRARDAESAGADFVGAEDLVEKIASGWLGFDKLIATPDMMVAVSKVSRILGPRNLMPNPKVGTVTMDVVKAVKEQKLGKVEYRADKTGIVHCLIGKKSFGAEKLKMNFLSLLSVLLKAKPPTSKGTYLKGVTISATMSPGIRIDIQDAQQLALKTL